MTKFATTKDQHPHEPATSPVFAAAALQGEAGMIAACPSRRRVRFSHQIWTRADGFTLSGPRRP